MPLVQRQPALHAMSQAPQFSGSTCKLTHAPVQDVSSVPQPALAPPLDAPPTLEPACPVLAPALPALVSAPELPELPSLGAPELPIPPALPVAPALPLLMPPAAVAPAAPAEPPSDVVLLEQPSNERHAPQARRRNHRKLETGLVLSAISFTNSKFEFEHGIGV
jgi:hypothetical protein